MDTPASRELEKRQVSGWKSCKTVIPKDSEDNIFAGRNGLYPDGSLEVNHKTAGNVRGMYAVRAKGRVPENLEVELESLGIEHRPRDQTDID